MTSVAQQLSDSSSGEQNPFQNPLKTSTGVYITVHGHFYQPPRENPYLDIIERQPSATPFHDWNERIHHECYRPNAFARLFNNQGNVVGIINNFEYLSFNIGPTLMSWLQRYDLETYQRILEADRKSCDRLNGHGNAIAQAYNHMILPLANERDKYTQIRWGKADFQSRFSRDPEGMWLAETAVDYPTLEVLAAEGIKFIILAPTQAKRCRPIPTEENDTPKWHEVGGSQIDPTRPYRCFLHNGQSIDIFFYDGPISGDMGFGEVLKSSQHFAGRLGQAVRGDHRPSQLISVATDGETFGHHKSGKEKCIAYAFTHEFPGRGWTVSNFAHYLSLNPPTWEVQLKPVTAWSCSHGVDRWQEDCGCGGGGEWHQRWRRPLRDALDWLRDQLIEIYHETGKQFFHDPWQVRDQYIEVILDRTPEKVEQFLRQHQNHDLNSEERIDALRLLEMQRHALLMYTSCGWFFEEISRPEGVQILRYASRAIELAGEIVGVQLETEFRHRLAHAPSNVVEKFSNGADIYDKLVSPARISFEQVAAHYGISSLFTNYPEHQRIYCYDATQLDYQRQKMGSLALAVGQLQLVSQITGESRHFVFAVFHLGGWDFHCCIQPFTGRLSYTTVKDNLFASLKKASAAQTILIMTQVFGEQSFSLADLFSEERHRIMQQLTKNTKTRLDQLYTQVYRDNYGVLMAFHRDNLTVPQELQVAAEVALSHRCLTIVRSLEHHLQDDPAALDNDVAELEAIATEVNHMQCQLKIPEVKTTLEQLIGRSLWYILHDGDPSDLEEDIQCLERLIEVGKQLNLALDLDRPQELYFNFLHSYIVPQCVEQEETESCRWDVAKIRPLLRLGDALAVEVNINSEFGVLSSSF